MNLSQMVINYKSNYNCEMRENYDHMKNINSYIRIKFAIHRFFYHDSKSIFWVILTLAGFAAGYFVRKYFSAKKEGSIEQIIKNALRRRNLSQKK